LRVLLLALAVIDDMGAIVVIALFYSGGVQWSGLLVAAIGTALVFLWQRIGVRKPLAYVVPGVVIWAGMLKAGVHPTIAGVALALLVPVGPWYGCRGFEVAAEKAIREFEGQGESADAHHLVSPLRDLNRATREAIPPVARLEAMLQSWVAYGIMPLFALAN